MEDEERKKKLLAGKEKLAAFQRKRSKRKKKRPDGDPNDGADTSSIAGLSDLSYTDQSDLSSMSCDESDAGSTIGDEEDMQLRSATRHQLSRMSGRVMELEEILMGKQAALDHLAVENETLKSQKQTKLAAENAEGVSGSPAHSQASRSTPDPETDSEGELVYKQKWEEFQSALQQRDEVIKQLSANLKAVTENRDTLQCEYTSQAEQLAQQVQTLQLQLQQAGEWLKTQTGPHGISVQALLEAKNEILALQQTAQHKDSEISSLKDSTAQRDAQLGAYAAALQQRDDALTQLAQRCQAANTQIEILQQSNKDLEERISKQQDLHQEEFTSNLQEQLEKVADSKSALEKEVETLRSKLSLKDHSMQQMAVQLSEMMQASTSEGVEAGLEKEELESKLAELQKELKEKVDEASSLKEALDRGPGSSVEDELAALKQTLQQKDQCLQQLSEHLAGAGKKDEELEELKHELEEAGCFKDELNRLKQDLADKTNHVISLENSLEQQTKLLNDTSDKLLQVTEQLQQKEQELKGDIASLQDKVNQKDKSLQDLSNQLLDLNNQVSQLNIENKSLKENENRQKQIEQELMQSQPDIGALQESFKQKDASLTKMTDLVTDLRLQLQKLQEQNAELQAQAEDVAKLRRDLAEIQEDVKIKDQCMRQMAEDTAEYKKQLDTLTKQRDKSEKQMETCEQENTVLQNEKESTKKETEVKEEAAGKLLSEIKDTLAEKEKEVECMKANLNEKDHCILQLQTTVPDLESQVSALKSEKESLSAGIGSLQKDNDALNSEIASLHRENGELCAELEQNKASNIADTNKTIAALQENVSSQEDVIRSLKEELAEKDKEIIDHSEAVIQRDRSIAECASQIKVLSATVENLNAENKTQAALQVSVSSLEGTLKEQEDVIRSLKEELAEKDKEMIDHSEAVIQRDRSIAECASQIKVLSATVENLNAENVLLREQSPETSVPANQQQEAEPLFADQAMPVSNDPSMSEGHGALDIQTTSPSSHETCMLPSADLCETLDPGTASATESSAITEKQKELNALHQECLAQKEEMQHLQNDIKKLSNEAASAKTEVEEIKFEVVTLQAALQEKQSLVETLQTSLQVKDEELVALHASQPGIGEELVSLQATFRDKCEQEERLQETILQHIEELDEHKNQIENLKHELQSKWDETKLLYDQQHTKDLEIESLKRLLDSLNCEKDAEIQALKAELEDKINEVVTNMQVVNDCKEEITSQSLIAETKMRKLQESVNQVESLQQQLDSAKSHLANISVELETKVDELDNVKEELSAALKDVENYDEQFRKKLEEVECLQDDKLSLQSSENELAEKCSVLEKNINELSEKMEGILKQNQNGDSNCQERLEEEINQLKTLLSAKDEELDGVISERDDLSHKLMNSSPAKVNDIRNASQDDAMLEHLTLKLSEITQKLADITMERDSLAARVKDMSRLQEELKQSQEQLKEVTEQLQQAETKPTTESAASPEAVQELRQRLQEYYIGYQQKEAEVLQLHDIIRQMTEQLTVASKQITDLQASSSPSAFNTSGTADESAFSDAPALQVESTQSSEAPTLENSDLDRPIASSLKNLQDVVQERDSEIAQLTCQLNNSNQHVTALEDQITCITKEIKADKTAIEGLQSDVTSLQEQLSISQGQVKQLHEAATQMSQQLTYAGQQLGALQQEKENLAATNALQAEDLSRYTEDMQAYRELKETLNELEDNLHNALESKDGLSEENEKNILNLTNAQEEIESLKETEVEYKKKITEIEQDQSRNLAEIERLKCRDMESGQVLQQMMQDIERLKREGGMSGINHSPSVSAPVTATPEQESELQELRQNSVSLEFHQLELDKLRAELEELHGTQIVLMKQQVVAQQLQLQDQLKNQLHTAVQERSASENQTAQLQAVYDAMVYEKDQVCNALHQEKESLETTIKELQEQHEQLEAHASTKGDDVKVLIQKLEEENLQYKADVQILSKKLEDSEKEVEDVKAELKETKITLYDYESQNPDVAVYRKKLQEMHSTFKVTWIENETLKSEVGMLKSQLGYEEAETQGASGGAESSTDEKVTLGNPAVALRKQLDNMKAEYEEKVECLQRELENLKSRMKELQINRDSLITKHEHDIRVKTQESGNAMKELGRQIYVLKSQLGIVENRCHQADTRCQQLKEERDVMEDNYSKSIDKLKQQHTDALAHLNSQLSQGARKVYIPVKSDGKSQDPHIKEMKAQLENLASERDRLVWERDQACTERNELLVEREILMAEKQQLVVDRDSAFADKVLMEQVSRGYSQMSTDQLSHDAQLDEAHKERAALEAKLSDTLFEKEELAAKLDIVTQDEEELKITIESLVKEKSEVEDENCRLSVMVNELDIYKGNTDLMHGQKQQELKMKVKELEHKVEQMLEEERFKLEEVTLTHEETVTQLNKEIDTLKIEKTSGPTMVKEETIQLASAVPCDNMPNSTELRAQLENALQENALLKEQQSFDTNQQLTDVVEEMQTLREMSEQKQAQLEKEVEDLKQQLAPRDQAGGSGKRGRKQGGSKGMKPSGDTDRQVEELQKKLEVAQAELQILKSDEKITPKSKKGAKQATSAKSKPDDNAELKKQLESAKAEVASLKKQLDRKPNAKPDDAKGKKVQVTLDKKLETAEKELSDLKKKLSDANKELTSLKSKTPHPTKTTVNGDLCTETQATNCNKVPNASGPRGEAAAPQSEISTLRKELDKAWAEIKQLKAPTPSVSGKGKKGKKGGKGPPPVKNAEELQKQLDCSNAEITSLRESFSAVNLEKEHLEGEADKLRLEVSKLSEDLQKLPQSVADVHEEGSSQIGGMIDSLQDEIKLLEESLALSQKKNEEISNQNANLQNDIDRYLEKLEEAAEEVEGAKIRGTGDLEVHLREAEEDRDQLRLVLDELESQNQHLLSRVEDFQAGDPTGEISILKAELNEMKGAKELVEEEKLELLKKLNETMLSSREESTRVSVGDLEMQIEDLMEERNKYRLQSAQFGEKVENLMHELNALRGVKEAEVYGLNQQVNQLQEELSVTKTEMDRRQSHDKARELAIDLEHPASGGDFVLESPRPEHAGKLFTDSPTLASEGAFIEESMVFSPNTAKSPSTMSVGNLGTLIPEEQEDGDMESPYLDREKAKETLLEFEQKVRMMQENYEQRIQHLESQLQLAMHGPEEDHMPDHGEDLDDLKLAHESELRRLRIDLEVDHEQEVKRLKQQHLHDMAQRLESQKAEHDRRFVEELQRVRRELKKQARLDSEDLAERSGDLDHEVSDGSPAEEDTEENGLEKQVFRLRKETQCAVDQQMSWHDHEFICELAEARDALLHQIDSSNAHQVELQQQVEGLTNRLVSYGIPIDTDNFDHLAVPGTGGEHELSSYSGKFDPYDHSMQDSLADYSESDLRAQINVLQRENKTLRAHVDNQNLSGLDDLQSELKDLQHRYGRLVQENSSLNARFNFDNSEYDEVTSPSRPAEVPSSEWELKLDVPSSDWKSKPEAPPSDWKNRFDALVQENASLKSRLDVALRSGLMTTRSVSMDTMRSRYETIVEENEVLRAKLGSYGLPTDGTPEEDLPLDVNARFDTVLKENETLRNKLDTYSMSSSSERDEDWRTQFSTVLKDVEQFTLQLDEAGLAKPETLTQGLEELQAMYDMVIKERDGLQVRIDTIMENAEKDFKSLQQKSADAETEVLRTKEKLRKVAEKASKEKTKLKARFVAASKEISVLKEKLDEPSSSGLPTGEDTDPESSESQSKTSDVNIMNVVTADKYKLIQAEIKALREENGSLKSRLMDKLHQGLHEVPLDAEAETADTEDAGITQKYAAACQEINDLRGQLDAMSGRMLDELTGYQVEADALVVKSEDIGHVIEDNVHAAQSRLSQLQTQCEHALDRECSVTESVDFLSTDFCEDGDSDTSADSLNLEMETDYEVLVVEYERLKAQGPAEVQRAYESVVGRHRLENGGKSPQTASPVGKEKSLPRKRGRNRATPSPVMKDSSKATVTKSLEKLQGQGPEKASLTVSLDRIRVATNSRQDSPVVNHASACENEPNVHHEGEEEHKEEWQTVALGEGLEKQSGEFVPEGDWLEQESISQVSEAVVGSEWSLPDANEIEQQIDDLVAFINDAEERGKMKTELLDLCHKYCLATAENESLKILLNEKEDEISKLRSESLAVHHEDPTHGLMGISWDSVPELREAMTSRIMGSFKDLTEIDLRGNSSSKLQAHINELKRAVTMLKFDNENLKKENVRLSSTFEDQTAKASWEINLMRSSYEDEIDELKRGHCDLSSESGRMKETLDDLKKQFEIVCTENEQMALTELQLRQDLEKVRSNLQSLFQEKENLQADLTDKTQILGELQGIDNFTYQKPVEGARPDITGRAPPVGDLPQEGNGGPGRRDKDATSNKSRGSTGDGGEEFRDQLEEEKTGDGAEKTWEELLQANEELRKRLREKCVELHQVQKFSREHKELLLEKQTLASDLSAVKDELQQVQMQNHSLVKENDSMELKLNAAVLQSGQELEEVKHRQQLLENENRGLTERLDRDIVRAERDVATLKQKCHSLLQEKDELEDDYKATREKLEKDISNLQDMNEELDRENEMLKAQISAAKHSAEKEVTEARTSVEGMAMEQMSMESEHKRIREKNRREIDVLKSQLESALKDKYDMKSKYEDIKSQLDNIQHDLQRQCNRLKEDNSNMKSELKEITRKFDDEVKSKEEYSKKFEETQKNLQGLESYHNEMKEAFQEEKMELELKSQALEQDYKDLSRTNEDLKSAKADMSQELQDLQAWSELLERSTKELEGSLGEDNRGLKVSLKETVESLNIEIKAKESLQGEKQDLERKLDALQKKYQILEGVYEDLQKGRSTEVDWFRKELDVLQMRYEEALSKASRMMEEAEGKDQQIRQACDNAASLQEEKGNMAGEIEILKSKVKRLEERQANLMSERNDSGQEREELTKELKELQNKYREKEKDYDNLHYRMIIKSDTNNKEIYELRQQCHGLRKECDNALDQKEILERDMKFLQERFEVIEQRNIEIEDAASAKRELTHQLQDLGNTYEATRKDNNELTATCNELKIKLDSLSHKYEVVDEERQQAISAKQAISAEMDGLMQRMQQNQQEKESMQEQLTQLQTKYDTLVDEMEEKEQQQGDGESARAEEVHILKRKLASLETQYQEVTGLRDKLAEELEDYQSKYRALEDMYERTKQQFSVDEQTLQSELETLRTQQMKMAEIEKDSAVLKAKVANLEEALEKMSSVGDTADPWHKEYLVLNDKYARLTHDKDRIQKLMEKMSEVPESILPLSSECRIGTNYSDLLEENSRLLNEKIQLENEIMSSKIDRLEVEAVHQQVDELKAVRGQLETKLKQQHLLYRQDKQSLESHIIELQDTIDDLGQTKARLERDLVASKQRNQAKEAPIDATKYVDESKLQGHDAMDILKLQIAHLKRECDLYERHVRDLEKEVEAQYEQLQQTSVEHKEMVKMLTETRLELEIYRAKHRRDVNKIEEVMNRIEGHISGRSSPRAMLLSQTLLGHLSGRNSPAFGRHSRLSSLSGDDEAAARAANFIPEDPRYFHPAGEALKASDLSGPEDASSRKAETSSLEGHELPGSNSLLPPDTPLRGRSPVSSDSSHSWPADYRCVRDELELLNKRNETLMEERSDLEARLRKQEDVVLELQKFAAKGEDADENRIVELFNHQLALLRQQRDQLSERIQDDRERDRRVLDLIHEKAILEEHFKQERNSLWMKIRDKEATERELRDKISALEKHIRQQQRLEDLVHQKKAIETDISRHKHMFEREMGDVEIQIHEQGTYLRSERAHLVGRSPQRSSPYRSMSPSFFSRDNSREASSHGDYSDTSSWLHDYEDRLASMKGHISDEQFDRLSRMKSVVEKRYRTAIDRLRVEVKADDEASSRHSSNNSFSSRR